MDTSYAHISAIKIELLEHSLAIIIHMENGKSQIFESHLDYLKTEPIVLTADEVEEIMWREKHYPLEK
jgi:hypothetical protein